MIWLVVFIVFLLIGIFLWGPIVSNVEKAKYKVVESHGNIEIRDYPPMVVAEVEVTGNRESAANKGFRLLANYIFGNNADRAKISMTAPVIEKVKSNEVWEIKFVMPSNYSIETLPKPNNPLIKISLTENKRWVVIRFSGLTSQNNLEQHRLKLQNFIVLKQLNPVSDPMYAFFNPPWTFPALRRNEIMVEVEH